MLNKNEESAWQKASASLDVSAKVYGYRVDSVHSDTFKFLGGLNRNKREEEEKEGNKEEEKENEDAKKESKIRRGQNTLETNINKLNLTKYDLETEVDPLFSIMTSRFNESTAEGLLLNTIPLDDKLNYILESKERKDEDINKNKDNLKFCFNLKNVVKKLVKDSIEVHKKSISLQM
jgi:condensin complex subunit 2